jgi:hypothetical protein
MMRRLIVALGFGAVAAVGALWFGLDQPGRWLAGVGRGYMGGYDIFIHDRYLILNPTVLLINFVAFSAIVYSLASLIRSGRPSAGA